MTTAALETTPAESSPSSTSKVGLAAYWGTTGVLALAVGAGGVTALAGAPEMLAGFERLGYPAYLASIIGVWKIVGALAILAPRLPRLKEWAYAGIFFNMTGAFASHLLAGDPVSEALPSLLFAAIAVASHALRPASRRLTGPAA